jgi:colanic acid biosynthesis glycosyl transferase WcaI
MHVLFINRYFYPDHAPTGVLLSDVAFALSQEGAQVTVITSRLRYDGTGTLPYRETVKGVEIHRVWTSQSGQSGLLRRSLDYGSFYLAGAWRLWRLARSADIIVAKTDPPLLSVMVAAIATLRGAKAVNWLQDVFPEVAEALDVGGRSGRLALRSMRFLRNWSMHAASANVVVGKAMAAHLLKEGVEPPKIRVISNWSDGNLIKPIAAAQNTLRQDWGLEGNFVVGYAGNLGRAHDVETIIEAMTLLRGRAIRTPPSDITQRIVFVFLGGGAQHGKLQQEVLRRQLTNVRIYPYQPQERLAETLGVADVHVVSLKPELEGLIVPSKFYGIAAAGRPALFVGASDGEIARLIDQAACGFTISPGDAQELTCRILQLASDPELCSRMGASARIAFEEHWDKARGVAQWAEILNVPATEEAESGRNDATRPGSATTPHLDK